MKMVITVINGAPDKTWVGFDEALARTRLEWAETHDIQIFTIRDMDIAYCCGCFACWQKTPGICVFKDDMADVLRRVVRSDLLLFTSPILAGFLSSYTKKAMDRLLPTVLPYIRVYDGECHHPKRYEKVQDLGVFLFDNGTVDEESRKIAFDHIDRLALNFHSKKTIKAVVTCETFGEVFANEVGHH